VEAKHLSGEQDQHVLVEQQTTTGAELTPLPQVLVNVYKRRNVSYV
jgi:hypothetical protein